MASSFITVNNKKQLIENAVILAHSVTQKDTKNVGLIVKYPRLDIKFECYKFY